MRNLIDHFDVFPLFDSNGINFCVDKIVNKFMFDHLQLNENNGLFQRKVNGSHGNVRVYFYFFMNNQIFVFI